MDYYELIRLNPELFDNQDAAFKIITDKLVIDKWINSRKKELIKKGLPSEWSNIGIVFNGPYFIIIRDLVEFPDGRIWPYSRIINQADLKGGQGVVILPKYRDKLLLLYNYRHATRSWLYEFPRGFGEPGKNADIQAIDELKEETGSVVDELIYLGIYYNNSGLEGNQVHMYFAKIVSIGEPDKASGIKNIKLISLNEFEDMIRNCTISDGFTIAAYTRAKLKNLI